MLKIIHIIIVIACIFLHACQEPKINTDNIVVNNIQEIVLKNANYNGVLDWESIVNKIELVPLEISGQKLVPNIDKMRIYNGIIYILNVEFQELFIFSKDGKFITQLKRGRGPNECLEIRDFAIDDKGNLQVLSFNEVVIFDKNGNYIKRVRFDFTSSTSTKLYLNPSELSIINNTSYLWGGSMGQDPGKGEFHTMYQLNDEFQIVGKYFKTSRRLIESTRFQKNGNKVFITPLFGQDTIYSISEGMINAEYFINFDKRSASKSVFSEDKKKSEGELFRDIRQTNLCGMIRNVVASNNYLYFIYFCSDKSYQAVISKSSKEIIVGERNNSNAFPLHIMASTEDKLIGCIEGFRVSDFLDKIKDTDIPVTNLEMMENIEESSNPVIFQLTLKDF